MEDLLIALADRRSFPETLFFVARGMEGETWSTGSVEAAAAAAAATSVLVLPEKEPASETEGGDGKKRGRSWLDMAGGDGVLSPRALSCMHFPLHTDFK